MVADSRHLDCEESSYSASCLKLLLTIGSGIDVMLEFVVKFYELATKETGFGVLRFFSRTRQILNP